jgi:hypothetical protein
MAMASDEEIMALCKELTVGHLSPIEIEDRLKPLNSDEVNKLARLLRESLRNTEAKRDS